jgi:hypothetical protein
MWVNVKTIKKKNLQRQSKKSDTKLEYNLVAENLITMCKAWVWISVLQKLICIYTQLYLYTVKMYSIKTFLAMMGCMYSSDPIRLYHVGWHVAQLWSTFSHTWGPGFNAKHERMEKKKKRSAHIDTKVNHSRHWWLTPEILATREGRN